MIKKACVIGIGLLFTNSILANTQTQNSVSKYSSNDSATIGQNSKISYSDLSKDLRMGKKWGFDFGLGVRSSALELKSGLSFFLTSDTLLQINYGYLTGSVSEGSSSSDLDSSSTYDWDDDWDDDDWDSSSRNSLSIEGNALGIGLKHFFGNSFYGRMGLDFLDLRATYDGLGLFSSSISVGELTRSALDLRIGNQWQWSNFSMGVDWFGLFLPFQSDLKLENSYYRNSELVGKFEDIGSFDVSFLSLYLGANF